MIELWDELNILKRKHAKLSSHIAELETKMKEEEYKAEREATNQFIDGYIELCNRTGYCMVPSSVPGGSGCLAAVTPHKLHNQSDFVAFSDWVERVKKKSKKRRP